MNATAAAIRDRIAALVTGITPTSLNSDKFRSFRNEAAADFRTWAEGNTAGAFRRYQVREVDDEEGPDVSNGDIERVRTVFELVVAYPQTHRYGKDNALDRDDVMAQDWRAINYLVGIYGRANFAGAYDCTPLGASRTFERAEGVDFLVVRVEVEYVRGVFDPVAAPADTWTEDATSEIGVPEDADEWAAALSEASITSGGPTAIYLCQDASGDLVDALGGSPLVATGTTGHLYQQSVTGWSRKAAGLVNIAHCFELSSFANTATTSVLLIAYVMNLSTPSATAGIAGMGASILQYGAVLKAHSTTVRARSTFTADGETDGFGTDTVRPVVLQIDVTGHRTRFYSDVEKLSPTWAACTGSRLTLGSVGGGVSISGRYLYAAAFTGTAAEMSDEQVKTLLEALGWTVAWS